MNFLRLQSLLLGALLLLTASCGQSHSELKKTPLQQWMHKNGKVKVLCTTSMIADLVQEIGKEHIDCLTLIQGESDPHSYQLVKGDDEKLARADLIFYSGLGLEHGPSLAESLTDSPKAFSIGDFLAEKHPQNIITYNGSVDPHIWMDVSLWAASVPFIAQKLIDGRPDLTDSFESNSKKTHGNLQEVHEGILTRISTIPLSSRYLVSAHEAFNYFVRAYLATEEERENNTWMIRSMAPEGLAPDSQLSTVDIQRLVDHIVAYNVKVLFAESNVSRDSLKKLIDAALKKGHTVRVDKDPLYVDAMGPKGSQADTYVGMLQYDAETIAKGLSHD
ncbi:MAG: zinc ABC transporter substrate-binding protein [Chlamydiales bacterium]|nr:zinc ABC transporter substrate-binding protein [Chlamydiales bacterium]